MTDLFFKEDANPDTIDGAINYRKREMVYESIEHIQRFRKFFFIFHFYWISFLILTPIDLEMLEQVPFQFEMPEPATTFLRVPVSLSEDQAYSLSLFFEPREKK